MIRSKKCSAFYVPQYEWQKSAAWAADSRNMPLTRRYFAGFAAAICFGPAMADERQLDFGITPDQAPKLAELAISVIEKMRGQRLDYSPESLKVIDSLVLGYRSEGHTPQSMGKTMVVFGCYVGEVMVRNLDYHWDRPSEKEYEVGFTSIGLRKKNGQFTNPIGKVFKLLVNGEEDRVAFLYEVAAQGFGISGAASAPAK